MKNNQIENDENNLDKDIRKNDSHRTHVVLIYFAVLLIATVCLFGFVFSEMGEKKEEDTSTVASLVSHLTTEATSTAQMVDASVGESSSEAAPLETTAVLVTTTVAPTQIAGIPVTPSWVTQDFINFSDKCRGGAALSPVKNIVIHYVGNPGSTAKENRDYFNDLGNPVANPEGHGASAHYVVGLSGEIVQCIPLNEVAFANYPRNDDTISVEVCHPDETGKFNDTTYWTAIRLTAWLCEQYHLTADDVIRHHDVSGKNCPKYYVEHEDAWVQFKENVRAYMIEHPDIASEMP